MGEHLRTRLKQHEMLPEKEIFFRAKVMAAMRPLSDQLQILSDAVKLITAEVNRLKKEHETREEGKKG